MRRSSTFAAQSWKSRSPATRWFNGRVSRDSSCIFIETYIITLHYVLLGVESADCSSGLLGHGFTPVNHLSLTHYIQLAFGHGLKPVNHLNLGHCLTPCIRLIFRLGLTPANRLIFDRFFSQHISSSYPTGSSVSFGTKNLFIGS